MSQAEETEFKISGSFYETQLGDVAQATQACVAETLENRRESLGAVHQIDSDFGTWIAEVNGPVRSQLESARRELAFSQYCVASGLYRQAYVGLRLFLELTFAAVYFSVNEFERRRWMSDRSDFSWSAALSSDGGVLSRSFVQEFFPSMAEDALIYSKDAEASYRHCSQFVHGKDRVSRLIPDTIEFSGEVLDDWCETAHKASISALFLLFVRYGIELDARENQNLSDVLVGNFSHLSGIREYVGLTGN